MPSSCWTSRQMPSQSLCLSRFRLNHSPQTFSFDEICSNLKNANNKVNRAKSSSSHVRFRHKRQILRSKCSRFELFFPMFSLLTVSAAQVIDCFLAPFSLRTKTFRGLDSFRDSPDSVIVVDDDCTQGKHILLLIFSRSRLMKQS